jgi:signal transduction histidine kinase
MEKRKDLEYELARISDDERRRFGQDVHDSVCQILTAARIHCRVLEQRIACGKAMSGNEAHVLSGLLEDALNEAYSIAQGLQPLEQYPEALAQALRSLAKRTQTTAMLDCQFISNGDNDVSNPILAQHLYRIAQEAVSNAVRHSEANKIIISLQCNDKEIILQVEDDGVGMNSVDKNDGMGMRTMTFRAQSVGGILTIDSLPAGGVRVHCKVPISSSIQYSELNAGNTDSGS